MHAIPSLVSGAVLCLVAPLFNQALATTTYAESYAAVTGYATVLNPLLSGAGGASIGANFAVVGAAVSSTSTAEVGLLTLDTWSSVAASTQGNGTARADWADGFIINAPGHDGLQTGTFSGSVRINGTLIAQFGTPGFASAISSATANISVNPNTGFNGGLVALQGGGRRINGTGFNNVLEGLEQFSLAFTNVPFTFGRGIDVYVRFETASSADSRGAPTYAEARYTLSWAGLSEVRDQDGTLLTNYTAISPESQFNYAVPEPSTTLLLLLGGCALLAWRSMQTRGRPDTAGR